MKSQFSRGVILAALTILLVAPVFVFTASYSSAAENIVDGDLVKIADNPDVYIVKLVGVKKFKRLILNPDIFNSYGHLRWDKIKTIDQGAIDAFIPSELVIEVNADGSVADPKVYRVASTAGSDVGERRWLNITAAEFEAAGYDWDSLYKVNHREAAPDFYPTKAVLTYQEVLTIKKAALSPINAFSITLVAPNKILAGYATNIVIKGTGFKTGAKVDFGSGSIQVPYGITNSEQITALIPAGMPALTYNLTITNPDGQIAILDNALTLQSVPQTVSGLTIQQVVGIVSPATVQIKNDKCSTTGYCTGSGVIFDTEGYILTNHHVIENDDAVEVKLDDGRVVNGAVLGWNVMYDLAIVKINTINITAAMLGDSNSVILGEGVVSLGYPDPLGLTGFPGALTISDGKIRSRGKTLGDSVLYLQTDARIQGGSSGGPLVNLSGKVIGINTACVQILDLCVEDLRYAVEINQAKTILNDLKSGVRAGSSTLTPTPSPTPTPQVGSLAVSKDPSSPTGNIAKDYTDQELARFSFSASGEAIKITSLGVVAATSENSGINNAKLYLDGMQIGSTADLTATITTFSFSDAFIIPAGLTKTLVIKGEVKKADGTSFSAENTIQVQLSVGVSNAQGQTYSTNISTPGVSGNTLTIKSNDLTLTTGSGMPIMQNRAMGQTNQVLATFKLTGGTGEGTYISRIIITDELSGASGAIGSISNLKLFKSDGTQIGTTIASMTSSSDGMQGLAVFNLSGFTIAAGMSETLTLKGDVNSYPNAVSGSVHTFGILGNEDIAATGNSTNSNINISGAPIRGNAQRVYRAELTIASAMSNFSGGASIDQNIGKYRFTNTSAGNYTITISDIDLGLSTTQTGALTATRYVTLKRDSVGGAVITKKGFNTSFTDITNWASSGGDLNEVSFQPFIIDASNGTGYVDVYVIADTNDVASTRTVSTSLGAGSNVITWSDGVSSNIITMDGIPVIGATATY